MYLLCNINIIKKLYMCFNIAIKTKLVSVEKQLNVKLQNTSIFHCNTHISAFSNPKIPTIISKNTKQIELCYWGLIPSWINGEDKAEKIRRMTYNARVESLQEKPSFKEYIKHNKCLIIADGFYEWQTTNFGKVCHYIERKNQELITFAGVWSDWYNNASGKVIRSVSIITQPANAMMEKIHNIKKRQPVIIKNQYRDEWFNSKLSYSSIIDDCSSISLSNTIVKSPLIN